LAAAALICLLPIVWFYFRATDRLAAHRAEEKYQQFVQRRNEALVYGLLAPEDSELFLARDPAATLNTAESAARQALALAGVDTASKMNACPADFLASRQAEVAADCYTLLLVLANVRGHQPRSAEVDGEHYQEALRILDSARQLGFQTRAYHLRRAHLLELLGRLQEAKEDKTRAASLTLEVALDHFLLGEEQYRRGEWEQAGQSFNRAIALEPGHFWAQFFLAVCHLKEKHWHAAKAGLNACLAQQADFVWAYLFRSFANERLKALPEAEADFQRALRLDPNEDARYVLLVTRGILRFDQRELELAAADFRSALALKPGQYNAYLSLAQVYDALGEFGEAARQFKIAMECRPPAQVVAAYHSERGRQLLHGKKYDEALAACKVALKLSPNLPQGQEVRGFALLALGRYEQAEQSFDEYLNKGGEPKSDIFRARGWARMKRGKYPEAVEDYTCALERAPDGNIYQHRGWAHFFSDAWRLALRDFSKAIELTPKTSDAYTGRGLARVMVGDHRGAVADAESALRLQPATAEMMHNIACIFAQTAAHAEESLQGEDRQSLARSYGSRAVDAVCKALAMLRPEERVSFWRDKVLPDAALTPIHSETAFQQLKDEYGHR
jgi:tetratricopeptide (TPR) repeat protein